MDTHISPVLRSFCVFSSILSLTHTHTHTREDVRLFLGAWRSMSDLCLTFHPAQSAVRTAPLHHQLTLTLCSIRHTLTHTKCMHQRGPSHFHTFAYSNKHKFTPCYRLLPHPAEWQDKAAEPGKGSEDQRTAGHHGGGEEEAQTVTWMER